MKWGGNRVHLGIISSVQQFTGDMCVQPPDAQFSAMWDTCETWRLRLPSAHDSMLHWATIVHWRSIIYDFMIQYFMPLEQNNANLYSLGFRDKSRSVNIMARAARKHGLPMLANHVINNMYRYPTMEVSEAFTKIQEQCKAYVDTKDHQAHNPSFSVEHGKFAALQPLPYAFCNASGLGA